MTVVSKTWIGPIGVISHKNCRCLLLPADVVAYEGSRIQIGGWCATVVVTLVLNAKGQWQNFVFGSGVASSIVKGMGYREGRIVHKPFDNVGIVDDRIHKLGR